MKKSKQVYLKNKDSTIKIEIKSWSEILLFLNNNGWKPNGLLVSFLGDKEVSDLDAEQIKIAGQEALIQVSKNPVSVYPVPFDMGKFAEIICFCEEGSFRISSKK